MVESAFGLITIHLILAIYIVIVDHIVITKQKDK